MNDQNPMAYLDTPEGKAHAANIQAMLDTDARQRQAAHEAFVAAGGLTGDKPEEAAQIAVKHIHTDVHETDGGGVAIRVFFRRGSRIHSVALRLDLGIQTHGERVAAAGD